MSELARLQRAFAAALHDGCCDEAAPRVRSGGVLPTERLALYRRNMRAAQHDALAATYPVVRRLVGDAFFRVLAQDYLRAWPSRSGNLDNLGDALAAFVATYAPAAELAYLADVARLEWACHESALAAEAPALDAAALARVPAGRQGTLVLQLHPSVRRVESAHPVVAIWEANQPDRDGALAGEVAGECALAWRREGLVHVRRAAPAEQAFLRAIAEGAPLDAAVAATALDDGPRVAALLERLGAEGVIAGFTAGEHAA